MYIPSYDFQIFDLPSFSPLEANEYGADTSFSANTPTWWMQRSLSLLAGLTQPDNILPYINNQFSTAQQTRAEIEAEVAKRQADYEKAKADVTAPKTCPDGYKPVSVFGIFSYCGKELKSDDSSVGANAKVPPGMQQAETLLKALPAGSGIFLIAVVIIIFLLLFVRR